MAHHWGQQRADRGPQLDHQKNQMGCSGVHQFRALPHPDPARHQRLQLDTHHPITPLNREEPHYQSRHRDRAHAGSSCPPLVRSPRRDQDAHESAKDAHEEHRATPHQGVRGRLRHRRRDAHGRRRQQRPDLVRGRIREALRCLPDPRFVRKDDPSSAQLRWQPPS